MTDSLVFQQNKHCTQTLHRTANWSHVQDWQRVRRDHRTQKCRTAHQRPVLQVWQRECWTDDKRSCLEAVRGSISHAADIMYGRHFGHWHGSPENHNWLKSNRRSFPSSFHEKECTSLLKIELNSRSESSLILGVASSQELRMTQNSKACRKLQEMSDHSEQPLWQCNSAKVWQKLYISFF